MGKRCVLCEIPAATGSLGVAYVLGERHGYREADTPDKGAARRPARRDPMCATHRRQVDDAVVKLMIDGVRPKKRASPASSDSAEGAPR